MDIKINGIPKTFDVTHLNYEDVITQAGYSRDRIISVVYSSKRSGDAQRSGTLCPGDCVQIEDGMSFSAYDTGNA